MSEQINGWLTQGGTLAGGVAALVQGGLLGGILLVIVVLAIAVKTAGPELREWVLLFGGGKESNKVDAIENPPASVDDDLPDAA